MGFFWGILSVFWTSVLFPCSRELGSLGNYQNLLIALADGKARSVYQAIQSKRLPPSEQAVLLKLLAQSGFSLPLDEYRHVLREWVAAPEEKLPAALRYQAANDLHLDDSVKLAELFPEQSQRWLFSQAHVRHPLMVDIQTVIRRFELEQADSIAGVAMTFLKNGNEYSTFAYLMNEARHTVAQASQEIRIKLVEACLDSNYFQSEKLDFVMRLMDGFSQSEKERLLVRHLVNAIKSHGFDRGAYFIPREVKPSVRFGVSQDQMQRLLPQILKAVPETYFTFERKFHLHYFLGSWKALFPGSYDAVDSIVETIYPEFSKLEIEARANPKAMLEKWDKLAISDSEKWRLLELISKLGTSVSHRLQRFPQDHILFLALKEAELHPREFLQNFPHSRLIELGIDSQATVLIRLFRQGIAVPPDHPLAISVERSSMVSTVQISLIVQAQLTSEFFWQETNGVSRLQETVRWAQNLPVVERTRAFGIYLAELINRYGWDEREIWRQAPIPVAQWMFYPQVAISALGSLVHYVSQNRMEETENRRAFFRSWYESRQIDPNGDEARSLEERISIRLGRPF